MRVRAATLKDASAIGEVHAEAWRVGFADIFTSEWLREAVQERRERWTRSLADCLIGGSEVLVVETDERVLGFVHFGPREQGGTVGEVFALYVHPNHWGTGAAQLLFQRASEQLVVQGFDEIVLWTLAKAGRARGFYDHSGWVPTGRAEVRDFGDGHPKEVIEYSLPS